MSRAQEIMSAMSLKKNRDYPDYTPAVAMALQKARSMCATDAAKLAE